MGLFDSIGQKFSSMDSDQKKGLALGLASGFAGMSGNPNTNSIMAGIADQQKALRDDRKAKVATTLATTKRNATAAYLRTNGREDLAAAMETGGLTAAQALDIHKGTAKTAGIQGYEYAKDKDGYTGTFEQWQTNLKKAGVPQPAAKGDTTWQTESAKAHVSMFKSNIEAGTQSRKTLMNTGIMNQLGGAMDSGVIPAALRKYIPEGLNGPIDAYNAILTSTALSLKGKGTGPMTDKDFDNLLATAGSISASPEARRIVQLALSENAKIALKIADISSQAISGSLDRLEASKMINKLMQSEPLTDEMRSQLSVLTGGTTKTNLGDIDAANADLQAIQARIKALKEKQKSANGG